jgi:hypothetical protein
MCGFGASEVCILWLVNNAHCRRRLQFTMVHSVMSHLVCFIFIYLVIGVDIGYGNENGTHVNSWIAVGTMQLPPPKSLCITWRETCFEPEGVKVVQTGPGSPVVVTRNTSLRYELEKSAAFSGHRLRYSFSGKRPYGETGDMNNSVYTSTARDGVAKSLHSKSKTVDYPSGFICAGPSIDRGNLRLRPLLLAYFLSDSEKEVMPRGNVTVGNEPGLVLVGGEACDIVRISDGSRGTETHLYSSRRWPGLIRREVTYNGNGQLTRQIDLRFADSERDTIERPALLGWQISVYEAGSRLRSQVTAQVTSVEVNGTMDDKDFDIEFPPGSVYTDTRQSTDDGRPLNFIVNTDGTHRPILASELGRDLSDLIDKSPGEVRRRANLTNYWIWVFVMATGAAVACFRRQLRDWIRKLYAH